MSAARLQAVYSWQQSNPGANFIAQQGHILLAAQLCSATAIYTLSSLPWNQDTAYL